MTKDLRLKIYPAVIAILGLGLVALLLSRVEIQVANQSPLDRPLDRPLNKPTDRSTGSPDSPTDGSASSTDSSNSLARTQPLPSPLLPMPSIAPAPPAALAGAADGGLRVSNQTAYPVRVALLYQQLTVPKATTSKSAQSKFEQPVHWDFAPEEGGAKGLIMSLPTGGLRLTGGDVLVAFAQDGSRRYWGPYIVGKTELPTWSSEQKEWVLPLRP